MRIGILCAGDREAAPFLPWIEDCRITEKAMLNIHEGTIEKIETAVLFSGVCKVNAAIAAQILIDSFGCDAIINCGTAGAMDERLRIFDTVIAMETAYHDVAQGILTQFHPWHETGYFKADDTLAELASRAARQTENGGNVYLGRIMTGEQFVGKEVSERIKENYAPLCVDMETASVAHVCYVNRIPFAAVRTISDVPRDGDEDAFDRNCDCASQISATIVRKMLRMMAEDGRASSFGRQSPVRLIRASLSDAETVWRMQVKAFMPLLEKYRDYDTNPANETLERVRKRFEQPQTHFYLISADDKTVGAIRVYVPENGASKKRISPLFVLPEYQGRGIAQAAIREAERIHGGSGWQLETVLQEAGNCVLYEKMGYRLTGKSCVINERMTLVAYEK